MAARYLVGESSTNALRSGLGSCCRATMARSAPIRSLASLPPSTANPASSSSTSSEAQPGGGLGGHIGAYTLLSRLPIILAAPTPFEAAYYAYNTKLERALSLPFHREQLFKKGSQAEAQFLTDEAERQGQMGEAWSSEETIASQAKGKAEVEDTLALKSEEQAKTASDLPAKFAFGVPVNSLHDYPITSRTTEADEKGDVRSLDRKLDRMLYLAVKDNSKGGAWSLPYARISKAARALETLLHRVAPQTVYSLLGRDLDIWMVTNVPVGVIRTNGEKSDDPVTLSSESDYVMRAHIVAGHPAPARKEIEYAWLTREELQERLDGSLYSNVEDLLNE